MGEDDFAAAFTAAEGWGLYRQQRSAGGRRCELEVRHGTLALESLAFGVQGTPRDAQVRLGKRRIAHRGVSVRDGRIEIELRERLIVAEGQSLQVEIMP